MRIAYLCDANSIHSYNLIRFFAEREYEIIVISTKSCDAKKYDFGNVTLRFLGSARGLSQPSIGASGQRRLFDRMPALWTVIAAQRRWLKSIIKPFLLKVQTQRIVDQYSPDVLHVLRTCDEGFLASFLNHPNIVLSLWGNDLVYWARHNFLFRHFTKRLLKKTQLLLPDTYRDKYLAEIFGFPKNRGIRVMPVQGGISKTGELESVYRLSKEGLKKKWGLEGKRVIIANRGFYNWYIKTEAFVRALPNLLRETADYFFFIEGNLASPGYNKIRTLVDHLGVADYVTIDQHSREKYLEIVRLSDIIISMATIDGLPISLLEALYLETFPMMCFQRSYDRFFKNGENCLFFNWNSEKEIESCIIRYYHEYHTDRTWIDISRKILKEKCNYKRNLCQLEQEYQELIDTARLEVTSGRHEIITKETLETTESKSNLVRG